MIVYDGELDTVGVCVVTNGNHDDTVFFFNDLIKKLTVNCRLYIYDVGSDVETLKYFSSLADSAKCFYAKYENKTMPTLFNHFVENVREKYIALVSIDTILDNNWIGELIYHYKNFERSGCISVRSQNDRLTLKDIMFNEFLIESTIRKVWDAPMNMVSMPMFFERSIVNNLPKEEPYFNEEIKNPNQLCQHFSFKISCLGFSNYHILQSSCLKLTVENQFLFPFVGRNETAKFKETINEIALNANENHGTTN